MKKYARPFPRAALLLSVFLIILTGCSFGPKPMIENMVRVEGKEYFLHRVRSANETVDIIANWYLGGSTEAAVITAANPQLGATKFSDHIKVGTLVLVPTTKLLQKTLMPESFVASRQPPIKPKVVKKIPLRKPVAKVMAKKSVQKAEEPKEPVPSSDAPDSAPSPTEDVPSEATSTTPGTTVEDDLLKGLLTPNKIF